MDPTQPNRIAKIPMAIQTEEDYLAAYDQYSDAIFRFSLFRVRDREHAKDVTQEVFIRTWKYFKEKGEITNCKPFLYTIALRLIINESRRHKAQSLDELTENIGFEPADGDMNDHVDARSDFLEGEEALRKMDALSPKYREVIHYRFVQELSPKEIAEITGESQNVISVRIHRALKELKRLFNARGGEPQESTQ